MRPVKIRPPSRSIAGAEPAPAAVVRCPHRSVTGLAALLLALWPAVIRSQSVAAPDAPADSVDIIAGAQYKAGGLHRFLLGDTHRDLWTTSMRVAVLNLQVFAGGLRPLKESGGNQTRSLRLITSGGVEYVFRSVDKDRVTVPAGFDGTVIETIGRDQVSSGFPAAALATAPMLAAAGVLHPTPILVVMPDDPLLGEFQGDYAGRLGMLEEYPGTPEHGAGFAGAVRIIDSDKLLALLDSNPAQQVDARALLAARLMDMMFNDWDRHEGQWKWAQLPGSPHTWVPVARDRDKAFGSYGGTIPALARMGSPNLMAFDSTYPSMRGLTWNSLQFDRRLLSGLGKPVFDSVAAALLSRVTDSVIDVAVRALPPEYQSLQPQLAQKLKLRRDGLPVAADHFYLFLAPVVDIHATDEAERVTVTRVDDRFVEVQLQSTDGTTSFSRRFDREETRAIRVYLHGGNDSAVVVGDVHGSIPVRIIGGNGTNHLFDSSLVGGSAHRTRLYDAGEVSGISYGPDTLFDRRPWVKEDGKFVPPGPDYGGSLRPIVGFGYGDLGFLFGLGVSKVSYGFRRRPYASRLGIEAEYSTGVDGFRVGIAADRRRESSPLHFTTLARVSLLQVINFFGFGNATPGEPGPFFDARQRQWLLQPALALDAGARSTLSFGPVIQYSTTDSMPDNFITTSQPYGFGNFGQAGLQFTFHHDSRQPARSPKGGFLADVSGSLFPAIWDVQSPFGGLAASAAAYLTVPVPVHPILVFRGGGNVVFGEYPFNEAAFIGGMTTVRTLVLQRYAGDASLYGTAELRIPVARFPLLVPLDVGLFGFFDAGRVYLDGESPGGWHTATGAGFWIGVLDPSTAVSVALTSTSGQTAVLIRAGIGF